MSAETRHRELDALFEMMGELDMKEGVLIADADGAEVSADGRRIEIVSIARWLAG